MTRRVRQLHDHSTTACVGSRARTAVVLISMAVFLQGCAISNSEGRSGVYLVPATSDTPGWIGEPAGTPTWSPDGSQLAWAGEDGLTIVSLVSGQTRILTTRRIVGRPAWSPTAEAIAFIDEGAASLVVADLENGETLLETPIPIAPSRQRTQELLTFGGPAWSPDGSRLAYACWDGAGDELCVIDADGANRQTVTRLEPPVPSGGDRAGATASSNVGPPAWSPDGSTVAVAAYPERRGATAGVFVIDLKQGAARRVSKLLPNSEISWTADGTSLLFSASEKGRSDAWSITVKTSQSAKLTAELPKGARSPALSPDGNELAVVSDGAIVILDDASEVRRFDLTGLRSMTPAWSPAGDEIAFAVASNPIQSYD